VDDDDDDDDLDHVDEAELTFELNDAPDSPFDPMENVRACCDGEHDIGTLSRRPSSRQHQHHYHPNHNHIHSRSQTPVERPASPSAWSFRSKANSSQSDRGSRLREWASETKRSIRFTNRGKSPAASRPPLPPLSAALLQKE